MRRNHNRRRHQSTEPDTAAGEVTGHSSHFLHSINTNPDWSDYWFMSGQCSQMINKANTNISNTSSVTAWLHHRMSCVLSEYWIIFSFTHRSSHSRDTWGDPLYSLISIITAKKKVKQRLAGNVSIVPTRNLSASFYTKPPKPEAKLHKQPYKNYHGRL